MSTAMIGTTPAAVLAPAIAALHANRVTAQLQCFDIAIPDGRSGASIRGHSVDGPRCFEFTLGHGRAGTISIVEGNGTLVIEGVIAEVKRHDFDAGPWTYHRTVTPEPIGGAGGPFELQLSWR